LRQLPARTDGSGEAIEAFDALFLQFLQLLMEKTASGK